MATSIIRHNVSKGNVSVNPSYGTSHLEVKRHDGTVTLFGYIDITTQVPAYSDLIIIPDGFKPNIPISVFLHGDGNKWLYGYGTLSPQKAIPAGTYYVTKTYVTN